MYYLTYVPVRSHRHMGIPRYIKKSGPARNCRNSLRHKGLRQKKVQNKFFEKTQILILGGHLVNVKRFPHRHFTSVFTV